MDRSGPLANVPTVRLSRYVMNSLTRIELESGTIVSPISDCIAREGLYILARGELRSERVTLSADHGLPIIYVDLNHRLVHMDHEFEVSRTSGATLLHLDAELFQRLDDDGTGGTVNRVVEALMRSLISEYQFDAFVSYNRHDLEFAEDLKAGLENAGLRVFLDRPHTGVHFTPGLKTALFTSLAVVPIISSHVQARGQEQLRSWVEMEIAFRLAAFDGEANVLPVRTEGGDVGVVPDVTHIEAAGRSDRGVAEAVVEAIQRRPALVPYATHRHVHPLEFEPVEPSI
jgi:hypothetical protein